ncbi:hypothetical protein C3L33_18480, partial [Rhododendron williamsianum]
MGAETNPSQPVAPGYTSGAEVRTGELFRVEMMDFSGSTSYLPPKDAKLVTSKADRKQSNNFCYSTRDPDMAPPTPRLVVPIDLKKQPREQKFTLHNRWHPDIPPVAEVKTGEVIRVEMLDWTGGIIKDDDSANDVKFIDLSVVNADGAPAKPGDLLVVEICNLGPLPGDEWGYTATFDRENGGGFLTDHFPCATKAIWYFEGIYAYSPHIPGVRFPGLTHPGIIGTAPSMELLNIWNERERELEETGLQTLKLCEVLHSRPLANLPSPKGCLLGKIKEGTSEWEKIAHEAARTIPGRKMEEIATSKISAEDQKYTSRCEIIRGICDVGYQIYLLLSCCPCEGRISGIVDSPNACATLAIPTAIFDQDIRPKASKVPVGPRLVRNPDVLKCTYDGNLPTTKNPCSAT